MAKATRGSIFLVNKRYCYCSDNGITYFSYNKLYEGNELIIKDISKEGINYLLENGIIKNSHRGYINAKGEEIGYYRTKGVAKKRKIMDYYADIARKAGV